MRLRIFLVTIICLTLHPLSSQGEITHSLFVPPEYYVGDKVELRLKVKLCRGESLTPPLVTDSEWLDIKDVEVDQNGVEAQIIITFASFSPGTRALPNLDFGSFYLSDFKIYTKSMEEGTPLELQGLRPQVMIPGSRLYFFLLILACFVLPYLFYFLVKFLVKIVKNLVSRYYKGRPYRQLARTLKKLEGGLEKISVRDFFIALCDALRIYLTVRTGHDCKSATTREISRLHGFGLEKNLWDRLVSVLKRGDMVKFGGELLSLDQIRENLNFVQNICLEIENREDSHVKL